MNNKIKVLIADDIIDTITLIKRILLMESDIFEVVGEATNGEEVLELIPKVNPDVVLMDINMPVLNGLEATEQITNTFPNVIVIIMSVQGESEYLKKAMLNGAKEYIIKPFNVDDLIETIRVTYTKYRDRQIKMLSRQEKDREGKVITFFSSKGGVGKSVLALNCAVMLSKNPNKKVLLIDMDLQFGDISILTNQINHKSILDLVDEGQLDSYENIIPYLYIYNENLHMMFAPGKPEAAEYIGRNDIEKIIKACQKHYDVLVIDTGINFNDNTLFILDYSHTIIFVSTMEITALKNTKLGLNVMRSLGYDKSKVKLVINKMDAGYGVSKNDVEETFKDNLLAMIPRKDKIVGLSVNRGQPICDSDKYNKIKVCKAIEEMCSKLTV
ncbi:MAG TPA: response regulator/pilus assembly protein [Clostridiaceae bacterium]|jgi:pilus assembly protein CpaE|nr:response regulator/pilus assembly protein [Clostridiaceae bacterium]